jgi:ADP-heptose:LPS heptosyltransferase/predicted SAM-dependent methyltransferase
MVWKVDAPQGREAAKVRFDVVPYLGKVVLDLGCGPDKISGHAIGVDNGADTRLFGIQFKPDVRVDSCERLPMFADSTADTVFSSHLLEHIVDTRAALAEWWRLVKVGGYLVLYLPHRKLYPNIGHPGANPDHKHDFLPDDIVGHMGQVAEASGCGWELVVNEDRNADYEYSFLQVYRKREHPGCDVTPQHPPPPKGKSLGLVRLGAYGDALWISTLLPHFKSQGWHITVYTQHQGETMLRHDPNVDRLVVQPTDVFNFGDGSTSMMQTAYWLHLERKHDHFINLIGAVERRLLPAPYDPDFYLPDHQRRRTMGRNYIESLHEWAGVPFDPATVRQLFHPTAEEMAWAAAERAKLAGPVVLINPGGSSAPKWWPYAQECADALSAEGINALIVGDLRQAPFKARGKVQIIGTQWPIRKLLAFAQLADVVIGTESVLVNAVAHTDVYKIVLLSHSTHENLTRDWFSTLAIEPQGLKCYPCHRIHGDWSSCTFDREEKAAACQSAAKADLVLEHVRAYLAEQQQKAAE